MGNDKKYHIHIPCWMKVMAIAAVIGVVAVSNKKEEKPYKSYEITCNSHEDFAKNEQELGCLQFTDSLEKRLEKLNCTQSVNVISKNHEGVTIGNATYSLFCDGYDQITLSRYFEKGIDIDFVNIQTLSKEEASRKVLRQIEVEDYLSSGAADHIFKDHNDPAHFAIRHIQEKLANDGYSGFPVSIKQLNSLELSDNLGQAFKYVIKDGAVTLGKERMQFTDSVDRFRFAMKELKVDDFGCVNDLKYTVYEYNITTGKSKSVYEYVPKKMGYCEKLLDF